mmetsp:Transcript_5767/g.11364  ORF Transcript_5767/g.11364 Transcript_5767/m.11364 type:complete len:281 (-) Transcript_5767:1215-2057(-)
MCFTVPCVPMSLPSVTSTAFFSSSLLSRPSSAITPFERRFWPICCSSTVRSSPEVESSLKDECSTLTMQPTDARSSMTRSCSPYAPSRSRPCDTSAHSCTNAAETWISDWVMSETTVSIAALLAPRLARCFSPSASPPASSTRTTMPVSPTWRVPPTILTWLPISNHLTSSSAWKESSSVSFSCLGRSVTMLPSTETECTLPMRFFRSPSVTLTRSPTASICRELLADVAAASSSSSAALPRPDLKRSSSGSEGVTSSPQRRPLSDTSLIKQPSSKVCPS